MSAPVGLFSLQQAANYYSNAKETVKARWVYYTLLVTSTLAGAGLTHLLFKASNWDIKVIAISAAILSLITFIAYRVLAGKEKKAEDYYNIGKLYEREQDYTRALKYYLKAKELNYAPAIHHIGMMYEKGISFTASSVTASQYYDLAKSLGYSQV